MIRCTALALALLAAAGASHAGSAEVRYVDPDRYTDAERSGFGSAERQRTMDALTRQFETLAARHLGADDRLSVEVLDIDLAGTLRMAPSRFGVHEARVLKGLADVPRLAFRYRLQRGDAVLAAGDARLVDLGYLDGLANPSRRGSAYDEAALPHEARMLARWFEHDLSAPQRQ